MEKYLSLLLHVNLMPSPKNPDEVYVDEQGRIITENETNVDSVFSTLNELFTKGSLKAVDWGINIITIVFIAAIILMIISMIFKVGQWQKIAQQTMMWSFIGMLLLRAIPITILSFQSGADVDHAMDAALIALCHIAIFIGITGVLLSFLFKFGHKLIEHPEYHRWSKNVLSVSVVMIFFAVIGPMLFKIM